MRHWWRYYVVKGYHPSIRFFDTFLTDCDPGDEDEPRDRWIVALKPINAPYAEMVAVMVAQEELMLRVMRGSV